MTKKKVEVAEAIEKPVKKAAEEAVKAPKAADEKKVVKARKAAAKAHEAPQAEDVKAPAAAEKKPAKKAVKQPKTEHIFEIDGAQINASTVEARVLEACKAEGLAAKEIQIYYNFAERRAYYVADGKAEDRYVAF